LVNRPLICEFRTSPSERGVRWKVTWIRIAEGTQRESNAMEEIKKALHHAYTGEAKATLRLKVYAEKAREEGYPQVARLFEVISLSEELHGRRALRLLKEIKGTQENLKESFESETKIAGVAYDEFIKLAEKVGDRGAFLFFSQSRDVEDTHAKLYKEAMAHLLQERETTYYVCGVCGYVADGALPEECPICEAKKDQFVKFDESQMGAKGSWDDE
jgi:rubrerythrin